MSRSTRSRIMRSRIVRGSPLLLATFLAVAPSLAAQAGSITGTVLDETSGTPIPAAQVFVAALELGVLTQQNGTFSIQGVPAGTHTLSVQRLGYRTETQDVTVSAGETVSVSLTIAQAALQLDQVIVTGTPGGTQRRAIGNTVQRMDVAEITRNMAVSTFQDLLSGRTPGIRFSVLSGNVGVGSQITLRGVGSFNTGRNNPLIYVDGIRVNNDSGAGPRVAENSGAVNVLNDFNPEDIESIEIIKGPAAATLYGSEASAGVIQIITKRGNEGAPEFTFSVRQGTNFMMDPAGRLGTQWTCATSADPGPACPTMESLTPYNMYDEGTRYIREGYFDWETPNLFSYGHAQAYTLEVRGGTSAIRYFLSASYDDQTGIVKYNWDEAVRLRGNVGVLLTENLSLDVSTGFVTGETRFDQATPGDGGIWQDLLWSNGFYLDRITPFEHPQGNPRLGGFQEHLPTDVRDQTFAYREYDRFTGSATLNHTIPDLGLSRLFEGSSLTQRLILGIDKGWDRNTNLFPMEPGIVPEHLRQFTDEWGPVYTETVDGELRFSKPTNSNLTLDYAVTGGFVLNPTWTFDTSFGIQYFASEVETFTNDGQGFASILSRTINQIAQARINTGYSLIENRSRGLFVQQQVGWNDRAFLTAAVRWDANSTFGADAPPQRYPKISGTWVLSEESFWNFEALNTFRVRGAWGRAGRQPSSIAGFNTYIPIIGPGGASAVRPSSPGNPGIEPEQSTEIEFGFDYALYNDRFSGEFSYYTRRNEGALLGLATVPSRGTPGNVDQNLGRIDNWGWEATLSARVFQSGGTSFDLDLSADFSDNEIKSLGDYPGTNSIRVGLPFPNRAAGTWVVEAEFMEPGDPRPHYTINAMGQRVFALCDSGVSTAPEGAENPGQYAILPGGELVHCSEVTTGQGLFVGRATHPWSFTVSPRLSLMNGTLQVFALAEGQHGGWNTDDARGWGHIYNNSMVSRLENDPWWVAQDRLDGTGAGLSKAFYKADFWKLREVGAVVQVPQSLVERTGAARAALSFSARNMWTMWQKQREVSGAKVMDPEFGNTSNLGGESNFRAAPGLSTVSATLRVTF